jgi:hypothetical protein
MVKKPFDHLISGPFGFRTQRYHSKPDWPGIQMVTVFEYPPYSNGTRHMLSWDDPNEGLILCYLDHFVITFLITLVPIKNESKYNVNTVNIRHSNFWTN